MEADTEMDFSTVCRTCLNDSELSPIFFNSEDTRQFSKALLLATGVNVDPNDGYPQNMCENCIEFVNKSLQFRKSCREVQKKLQNIKNQLEMSDSISNIFEDDEISFEQDKTKIFVKIEPTSKLESKITNTSNLNMEYTDLEVLEHLKNEDKSLEYLDSDMEADIEMQMMFTENQMETRSNKEDESPDLPYIVKPESGPYKTKRVTCKLCQKDLSIRNIDYHMSKYHPGADQRKEQCGLCDKFIMKKKFNRHLKLIHGTENTVCCEYCNSEFDSKAALIEHIASCGSPNTILLPKKERSVARSRSSSSKVIIECDICHKTMQKGSLRVHKAVKHAGLGPVCEHCGRYFSNKLRLTEHCRAKHGHEKLKCDQCHFESASDVAMQNHGRRHRGEKPFVCACGAAFHAAYLLAQHRRSHAADRLVQCKLCPAKFKATNSLHMHKLSCHSGAIYKCTLCPKTYGSRQYAVKHMRLTHKYSGPIPELQKVDAEPIKDV